MTYKCDLIQLNVTFFIDINMFYFNYGDLTRWQIHNKKKNVSSRLLFATDTLINKLYTYEYLTSDGGIQKIHSWGWSCG
jgi:hypothetical protein